MADAKLTKTQRREAARKEAERLRQLQAARDKRGRILLLAVVAAVLALIIVAVVVIAQQANRTLLSDFEGATPAGSNLHGGIPFGAEGAGSTNEGAPEVAVYLDFMCPYCGDFEQVNGEDLAQAAANGEATVIYHPLNYLDRFSQGTEYSTRTAAAFAYVASEAPDKALDFMAALFAQQPEEGSTGLEDAELIQIAVEAGVPQEVADAMTGGTYTEWVGVASEQARLHDGIGGTPTVKINGEVWNGNRTNPGELLADIQAAG